MSVSRADVEIANRGADQFLRLYYTAYDSTARAADLPKMYRASSKAMWNGTALEGVEAVRDLAAKLPRTKHDVQSYDCHPVPGTTPPALLITVSGTVLHGPAAVAAGAGKGPVAARFGGKVEEQPRVFSQSFLLLQDPEAAGEAGAAAGDAADKNKGPRYYIKTDNMRFVG